MSEIDAAFALLLAQRPRFLGLARRFITPQDAEDLLQDAYERAWRAWPPRSMPNITAWFCVILRRLAIDRNNRHKRQQCRKLLPAVRPAETLEDSLWRGLDDTGLLTQPGWWGTDDTQALLQQMPSAYRETWLRYWVLGDRYDEIARQCAIHVSTVGSRLYRAKKGLYEQRSQYTSAVSAHPAGVEVSRFTLAAVSAAAHVVTRAAAS